MPTLTGIRPEKMAMTRRRRILSSDPTAGLTQVRDQWAGFFRNEIRVWHLSWELASKAEVESVETVRDAVRNGAGSFDYQPPKEVSAFPCRFVSEPQILATRPSYYEMVLEIEEV